MEPTQKTTRERLESQRWELMNSYIGAPWHDGLVRDRIADIDRRLSELKE